MKTDLVVVGYPMHENKVLLVHHKKLDLWLPAGGHIDKDETPDDALKREFMEELNLDIEILNRTDIPIAGNMKRQLSVPFHVDVHSVGDHDHCCFSYLCKPKNPGQIKHNEELKGFAWLTEEELDQGHIPLDVRNIARKAFKLI